MAEQPAGNLFMHLNQDVRQAGQPEPHQRQIVQQQEGPVFCRRHCLVFCEETGGRQTPQNNPEFACLV